MRANIPLIGAVLFLVAGLGLILTYGQNTSSFNMGIPIAASALQIAIVTTGPAVVGGVCLTAVGLLLLVLATILAILGEIGLLGPGWYAQRAVVEEVDRPARRSWFAR
jgi:hypothetical protein